MRTLIIDNNTRHSNDLKLLMPGSECTVVRYNRLSAVHIAQYGLIVLTGGSPFGVIKHRHVYEQEMQLIRASAIPIIGICLGAELIATTFAGEVTMLPRRVYGVREIEFINTSTPFEGMKRAKVFESHRYAIKRLSPELVGVARSGTGYEIVRHSERPIFGLQFHPELHPRETEGEGILRKLLISFHN